jgi:hypothetical protein
MLVQSVKDTFQRLLCNFFNRFSIVPELSSVAKIPLPGATSFVAMDSRVSVFMAFS